MPLRDHFAVCSQGLGTRRSGHFQGSLDRIENACLKISYSKTLFVKRYLGLFVHIDDVVERQLQAHLDSRGHVWAVVPTWTTSWGLEVGRTL